ncbi:MAG: hypothetical protein R3F11_08675 [Verrucomicrobiales bacterium]
MKIWLPFDTMERQLGIIAFLDRPHFFERRSGGFFKSSLDVAIAELFKLPPIQEHMRHKPRLCQSDAMAIQDPSPFCLHLRLVLGDRRAHPDESRRQQRGDRQRRPTGRE